MPREYWNKTSSFEHFGITLRNTRWSWSGVSNDKETVALVLWADGVKREGNDYVYRDDEDLDAEWRSRAGATDRISHLQVCRDRARGRFRAVIARAVDITEDPRQIAACFPQKDIWWKLDMFDDSTGAFVASIEHNVS